VDSLQWFNYQVIHIELKQCCFFW